MILIRGGFMGLLSSATNFVNKLVLYKKWDYFISGGKICLM
jgi:hypothetical protein